MPAIANVVADCRRTSSKTVLDLSELCAANDPVEKRTTNQRKAGQT